MNLIKNGSFENNTSGWYLSPNDIVLSTDKYKFGNYSVRNYHGGAYTGANFSIGAGIDNYIYYYSSLMYTANMGNASCYNNVNIKYNNTNHWKEAHQFKLNT